MAAFRHFAKAAFRGGIVFYISWPILYTAWLWTAHILNNWNRPFWFDFQLLAVASAALFSLTLGGAEFWRAWRRSRPG